MFTIFSFALTPRPKERCRWKIISSINLGIKALNLPEAEATSFYSFTVTAPAPFQGKKSKKSDIPSLDTPEKWKNKKLMIGVGYNMEKMLEQVHQEVALIIEISYQDYPSLSALANAILLKSVEFASSFIRWTDDTYKNLTAGGNLTYGGLPPK